MRNALAVLAGVVGMTGLFGCLMLSGQHSGVPEVLDSPRSGGATTVSDTSRDAFARPAANLPVKKLRDFTFGNKMFNTNWVAAPASVTTLDGLGPTFNRVSCSGCHFKDGRGRAPRDGEAMESMLVRLSVPGRSAGGGPVPHPAYGLQVNDRAIPGVPAEAKVAITYQPVEGKYPDGTKFHLRRPVVTLTDPAFGPFGEETMLSARVAPAMIGLGLLEAVPEKTLAALADPEDKNGDGISGRINHVLNSETGKLEVGRFGWKANVATLHQQDASAAEGDIGITSSVVPAENCPEPQTACRAAPNGGTPEMSDMQLEKLVFYSQTLAVPARRDTDTPAVKRGAELFSALACSSCHRPKLVTGAHPVPQLAHQTIQPFTDLLLHDMGKGLADNRPDYEAGGSEWRTAPLWGIGLVETVNGHHTFLHDGRARNMEEAILWHGGEAEASKNAFMLLPKSDRKAVLAFLHSL